ncbi:MAG TPA: hypothetical protein VHR45_16630 [Thermoanaerobaculia bacterium]|nr:hypothetical protein [Thermoanaerobaculia bacterium]
MSTQATPPDAAGQPSAGQDKVVDLTRSSGQANIVDLTRGGGTIAPAQISGRDIGAHSGEWAKIATPFTWFVFCLIAAVMLVPFLLLVFVWWRVKTLSATDSTLLTTTFDWAKTILAPVVGFGGSVIGYYFGTRGGDGDSSSGNGGT